MAQTAPLALTSAAHGQAPGWRKNEHLIDALPYIDPLPADVKQQVDTLIAEEMQRSSKRPADYLKEFPPVQPPRFDGHPMLQAEYERVKAKQPMPALDTTRYRLDPPQPTKRNDYGAWKGCLDNAHAQLEHQQLRILNLELLLKYGDKSWRAQTQADEALLKSMQSELEAVKAAVNKVNAERKLSQHSAGMELRKTEEEYYQLVRKNFDIEAACDKLEEEIAAMQSQLEGGQQQQEQEQQQEKEQEAVAANGAAPAAAAGGEGEGPAAAANGDAMQS